jgi:hypothetical protein
VLSCRLMSNDRRGLVSGEPKTIFAASRQRPFLGAGTGQRPYRGFVGGELLRGSGIDHDAVVKHIGVVRDFQTHARVLRDQQNGNALLGPNAIQWTVTLTAPPADAS